MLDRPASPALLAGSAAAAAMAWAAFKFAPMLLIVLVALLGIAAVAAAARRRPEVAIVALVGAAGLDSTGRLAVIGSARITVYQLVMVAVMLFAIARIRSGRAQLLGTPVDLPLLAFLAVAAASIFVTISIPLAVVQLISLLSCAVLVYLVCVFVDTPERAETVVLGILLLATVWSIGAFFEKQGVLHFGPVIRTFASGIRPKMTFKDPNIFGGFLAVSAALALPLIAVAKSWSKRVAILGGVGLCLMAILLSGSRGALAGFVIGALVMVLALRIPVWQKLLFVGAATLLLVVGVESLVSPTYIQLKVLGVAQDRSWIYRIGIVRSALAMASDNVFGVGGGNFREVYPLYRSYFVRFNLVESHTMLATLLVEYGALGLLTFLWLLWRSVSRVALVAWRQEFGLLQALATGVLGAGAVVFAQSFVYSLETSKYLWLTIGLSMAVYTIWRSTSKEENL